MKCQLLLPSAGSASAIRETNRNSTSSSKFLHRDQAGPRHNPLRPNPARRGTTSSGQASGMPRVEPLYPRAHRGEPCAHGIPPSVATSFHPGPQWLQLSATRCPGSKHVSGLFASKAIVILYHSRTSEPTSRGGRVHSCHPRRATWATGTR